MVYPLLLLSTFAHELGHGLTALMVDGQFLSLRVWPDGSGVAMVRVDPGWRSALVSAGGLAGPAVAAAFCFVAARSVRMTRWVFGLLGVGSLAVAIWFVRNATGWMVAGTLGVGCLLMARYAHGELRRLVLLFLAIQFGLAVFSNADYLFKRVAHTGGGIGPSDVTNIAKQLSGPYWFWGVVVGLFSVTTIAVGLYANLRSDKSKLATKGR